MGDTYQFHKLQNLLIYLFLRVVLIVDHHCFPNLFSNFNSWIQGCHRILKDHRDFLAANTGKWQADDSGIRLDCALVSAVQNASGMVDTLYKVFLYAGLVIAAFSALLLCNFISISISYKKKEIGILRAVGDSKRPFYFLVVSAVLNTVLDLVFVLQFNMGVRGVAYATIIAQGVSAVLILITLMRSESCIKLTLWHLKISWEMLGKIVRIGIPAAIQMAVTAFSNIFVQSYINYFGADCMSGWTAYSKIDQLILLPVQSISLASTTFVGQNLGINRVERAKRGVRTALCLGTGATILIMIPVMIFAPQLVTFFNGKAEVVAYGTLLLRWISPFYVLACFNQIYAGALRGAGNSRAPMVIMLCREIGMAITAIFL